MRPSGDWPGTGLAHEAFVFADDDDVARRCVPFVREGLRRDEKVLVVAGERVRRILQAGLDGDVERLAAWAPAEDWWRGSGAATLHAYHRDLRVLLRDGRPWRLVAEPVWIADPAGREWSRFEAVANSCYAGFPYYSLCLHDSTRVPGNVLRQVLATHPVVWDGEQPVPSPTYRDPAGYLRRVGPRWSSRPEPARSLLVTSAREARGHVRDAIAGSRWAARGDHVVLAVSELVSNALQVAPYAEVTDWRKGDDLVWEVADDGPGLHDATVGYVPPDEDARGGRGLWLARGVADELAVRPFGPGTAVRAYFRAREGRPRYAAADRRGPRTSPTRPTRSRRPRPTA